MTGEISKESQYREMLELNINEGQIISAIFRKFNTLVNYRNKESSMKIKARKLTGKD